MITIFIKEHKSKANKKVSTAETNCNIVSDILYKCMQIVFQCLIPLNQVRLQKG